MVGSVPPSSMHSISSTVMSARLARRDGKRIRRKVFGKTQQEVRYRLKALHQELNAGVRSPPHAPGLQYCSKYCNTVSDRLAGPGRGYRNAADTAIMPE